MEVAEAVHQEELKVLEAQEAEALANKVPMVLLALLTQEEAVADQIVVILLTWVATAVLA